MYGIYYKTPINFTDLMEKKDIEKTNLESSIAQYINLVATSSFGECKFNEIFGCKIWEMDFDLLADHNTLREIIKDNLTLAIKLNESRIDLKEVVVTISEAQTASYNGSFRMKKKVIVSTRGFIKKTNKPFNFHGHFFVGPLSYI